MQPPNICAPIFCPPFEIVSYWHCGIQQQNGCHGGKSRFFMSQTEDHYFGSLYEGCGSLSPL